MLVLERVTKDDLIYDRGCGDVWIVLMAVRKYGCKAGGYDKAYNRIRENHW